MPGTTHTSTIRLPPGQSHVDELADHSQDDQLDDRPGICFALFWATYRSYLDTAEPLRHDCKVTFVTTLQ